MNKLLTYSMFLLMLLSVSLLVVPNAVHASPGPAQKVTCKPTADNDSTNGTTVTSPGYAWDSSNATSADFTFGTAAGTFVVSTFNRTYLLGYKAYLTGGTFTVNGLTTYAIQGSQTTGSYAGGSTVASGESDIGATLVAFAANEKHEDNIAPPTGVNGAYDPGEFIYRDVDNSGAVSIGDVRLTARTVPSFPPDSIVASGNGDIGKTLVAFTANEKHRENIVVNAAYDYREYVYRDVDNSGAVSIGDIRLMIVAFNIRSFTSTTTDSRWGIRVWKRTSGGVETEITAGTPVATVSRSASGEGTLSATWTLSPENSFATTDALVVRVYAGSSVDAWVLKETYISFQLDATLIEASTWTVYYWTSFSTVTKIAEYRFGDSTYNSRIENLVYTKGPTISQVDLKLTYEVPTASSKGAYRIYYFVGSAGGAGGATLLQGWTSAVLAKQTRVWSAVTEPNDGSWSWSDIANIKFVVESNRVGGSTAGSFKEYEVWATITSPDATLYVDPASTTGLPIGSKFNISIEASEFYNLYGWEFKLGFDNTILNVFRGPLPPKYALNYYIWKNETETNTDIGNTLIAFAANEKHTENVTVNGIFDPNEFMYRDLDNSGRVSVNDVRLTAVGSYAAGSTVAGGDTDIDWGLIAFTANEKHRENIAVNAQFDPGEFMYRDTDVNGIVSNTDVRLTAVGSYPAGSTITAANQVWFSAQVPMGTPATSAPSGGGTLTIITFIVTGVGTTTLALSGTKMGDGNGLPIAHTVTNGSFSNVGVPEFPLGAALEIAIPVVLVFLWWTKRQKKIKPRSASTALPTLKA